MSYEEREPTTSVGMVCAECAPAPGKFSGQEPSSFVGKYVKLGFKATNPVSNKETKEHMWLRVEKVDGPLLVGTLDNDPVMETEVKFGDTINFFVSEIEEVYNESN